MDDNINKKNEKNENAEIDYKVCPTCGKIYPDDIINRIKTFKFMLTVRCPYCKSYHTIGEF